MTLHKTKAELIASFPDLGPVGEYTACGECGATDGWTYFAAWARCRCGYLRASHCAAAPTPEQIEMACDLLRNRAQGIGHRE